MPSGFQVALRDDKLPSDAGDIVWFVQSNEGWCKIRETHAGQIETGIKADQCPVVCSHCYTNTKGYDRETLYEYGWQAMTQTNPQSGNVRTIAQARLDVPAPLGPPLKQARAKCCQALQARGGRGCRALTYTKNRAFPRYISI